MTSVRRMRKQPKLEINLHVHADCRPENSRSAVVEKLHEGTPNYPANSTFWHLNCGYLVDVF